MRRDAEAEVAVVLDMPHGFALRTLIAPHQRRIVAVSWGSCPEYWEDLWDLGPHGLLAGGAATLDLPRAIAAAAQGRRYRLPAAPATTLTPLERQILQHVARGMSNPQIAGRLALHVQTVKNTLSTVFQKLELASRSAAILYYWDVWRPPPDEAP